MKAFKVNDVTLTSQVVATYKILISQVKTLSITDLFPQLVTVVKLASQFKKDLEFRLQYIFFLFLKHHSKTFKLHTSLYSYAYMLTSLYQFHEALPSQH